jgi:hypothetical protein
MPVVLTPVTNTPSKVVSRRRKASSMVVGFGSSVVVFMADNLWGTRAWLYRNSDAEFWQV